MDGAVGGRRNRRREEIGCRNGSRMRLKKQRQATLVRKKHACWFAIAFALVFKRDIYFL